MKLILFAAAARLARGADFCVPAACRKLAPGAGGFMENLVGDLECCAPRERAGCAAGYRYETRGKCTSGHCEEYATCCVHCVDGELCARVDAVVGRTIFLPAATRPTGIHHHGVTPHDCDDPHFWP